MFVCCGGFFVSSVPGTSQRGYSAWSNWTGALGLSEGQTGTIQRAGNKFLQAL